MIKHASKKVKQNEKLKNRKAQKHGSIFVNSLCDKGIRVPSALD